MDKREYIPYIHNGKIIMVPVLEMDEVKHLKPTTAEQEGQP